MSVSDQFSLYNHSSQQHSGFKVLGFYHFVTFAIEHKCSSEHHVFDQSIRSLPVTHQHTLSFTSRLFSVCLAVCLATADEPGVATCFSSVLSASHLSASLRSHQVTEGSPTSDFKHVSERPVNPGRDQGLSNMTRFERRYSNLHRWLRWIRRYLEFPTCEMSLLTLAFFFIQSATSSVIQANPVENSSLTHGHKRCSIDGLSGIMSPPDVFLNPFVTQIEVFH